MVDSSSRPDISVVIVTYNSESLIVPCLRALCGAAAGSLEVIVVDNASSDGTVGVVEREFPTARVVRSQLNSGFAGGVLKGAAVAEGRYLCLLNPDAIFEASSLVALVDRMREDSAVGVGAPMISQPDGRLRIVSAGHAPTVWRMFAHYSGLSRVAAKRPLFEGHYLLPKQVTRPRDVDWVTGACLVVPRSVWDGIGGISERWFMYAEDIELCGRVRAHGYRVRIYPQFVATHLVGASADPNPGVVNSSWITNLYDYYAADLSQHAASRVTWRLVVSAGLASRGVIYRVRGITARSPWRGEAKRFFGHALAVLAARRAKNAG